MKKDNLKRIAITADEKTLELCDLMVKDGEAKNRSRLICKAVKYYYSYLNREQNTEYLTEVSKEMIDKRLNTTEKRISTSLFKLAVEIASLMNVLAGAFELNDQKVRKMKHRVINEVKELNGWINLEDIIRYQNGEE
ncbi:MAG: hypothetical protein ACLUH5_00260 [Eubacterium sp.]